MRISLDLKSNIPVNTSVPISFTAGNQLPAAAAPAPSPWLWERCWRSEKCDDVSMDALLTTDLPFPIFRRGKVRDV